MLQGSVPPLSETGTDSCLSGTSLAWPWTNPVTWVLKWICCFFLHWIQWTSHAKLFSKKALRHQRDNTSQRADNTTQLSLTAVSSVFPPIKPTDFHNFLNQSNCNRGEMMFCEQRNPKLKRQVPAVRRSWLPTERHPHYSIQHTANTRKFPYGDVASQAAQRWSAILRFLWINKKLFHD